MGARVKNCTAMLIFGSIGLFVRGIGLSSTWIALVRGAIGALFLLAAILVTGRKINPPALRKNLWLLLGSGAAIGLNWVFLFEAYRYTTVGVATLAYYLAPVLVIVLSPWVLKEKLTLKKCVCVALALLGMACVAGVFGGGTGVTLRGVLLGVTAAVFYASAVLQSKFFCDISPLESTMVQLFVAAAVLLPYALWTGLPAPQTKLSLLLLLTVSVLHTGIGYLLYFSSLRELPGQTAAMLSYIDPVTAILLSGLLLGEKMSGLQLAGAALILGALFASEYRRKSPETGKRGSANV